MAVSDRIAIMNRGRVVQVGTPSDVYFRPASRFAAEFMGGSNILELRVAAYDGEAGVITAEADGRRLQLAGPEPAGATVLVAVRAESIRVVPAAEAAEPDVFTGTVVSGTFLGSIGRYRVTGPGGAALTIDEPQPDMGAIRAEGETVCYRIPAERAVLLRG